MRDALIHVPSFDIDLATKLPMTDVRQTLESNSLKVLDQGIEHESLSTICDDYRIDITRLRADIEPQGRKAKIAFTDDWRVDAERRDFRMNALYLDLDGHVYDPLGNGKADALAGRVCFIGNARERIQEDYLRILRFFRFLSWYGKQPADPEALHICQEMSPHLAKLSKERITHEIKLIFASPTPLTAVQAALEYSIIPRIFQQDESAFDILRLKRYMLIKNRMRSEFKELDVPINPLLRLIALLTPSIRPFCLDFFSSALVLTRADKAMIQAWLTCLNELTEHPLDVQPTTKGNLNRYLFLYGHTTLCQALMLSWVDNVKHYESKWQQSWHALHNTAVPAVPFTSEDIKSVNPALAHKPLGLMINAVQKHWLDNNSLLTREQCLLYAQSLSK